MDFFKLCTKIYVILCCATISYGSNILVINHAPTPSHHEFFSPIIEELVSRGHNVTYLSRAPYKGPLQEKVLQYTLYSDIIAKGKPVLLKMMKDDIGQSKPISPIHQVLTYMKQYRNEPCTYLENDFVANIMNSSVTYDVMMLNSQLSECFFSIAYAKNLPLILLSPSLVVSWHQTSLGMNPYFGIEKTILLKHPQDNLLQRTVEFIQGNLMFYYRYWLYASLIDNWLVENYPNIKFPPFYQLDKNVSLLMINLIPAMGYARSESPTVVNIGCIHCRQPQKLPIELEAFISGAGDHGFIYFSLGTTVQLDLAPKFLINILMETFKLLPQRVLMKWPDNSTTFPPNVMAKPWFPQQDIIGDPRLKVFITQGGIFSLQEAVYNGVPVIMFPAFADQFANAGAADKVGYGIQLDIKSISISLFLNTIHKIVNETRFKDTAKKLSSILRDPLNSPRELVVWWTEHVIRNGGTQHLRTGTQDMTYLQQQQLDVFFLLTTTAIVILLFLYYVLKITFKLINNMIFCKTEKEKKT